jgi:hypothetical protein
MPDATQTLMSGLLAPNPYLEGRHGRALAHAKLAEIGEKIPQAA